MESIYPIAKYLFTVLIVGGGLWQGLKALSKVIEAVSNGFKLRAEAAIERRRLEDEQIKTSYLRTLELLNIQSDRIESLIQDLSELEEKCTKREDDFRDRISELEGKITFLKADYEALSDKYQSISQNYANLKMDHESLKSSYEKTLSCNDSLRKRIRKLESKKNEEVSDGASS